MVSITLPGLTVLPANKVVAGQNRRRDDAHRSFDCFPILHDMDPAHGEFSSLSKSRLWLDGLRSLRGLQAHMLPMGATRQRRILIHADNHGSHCLLTCPLQPFVDEDHAAHSFFPPRVWAIRLPVMLILLGSAVVGSFISLVMIRSNRKKAAKAAKAKKAS